MTATRQQVITSKLLTNQQTVSASRSSDEEKKNEIVNKNDNDPLSRSIRINNVENNGKVFATNQISLLGSWLWRRLLRVRPALVAIRPQSSLTSFVCCNLILLLITMDQASSIEATKQDSSKQNKNTQSDVVPANHRLEPGAGSSQGARALVESVLELSSSMASGVDSSKTTGARQGRQYDAASAASSSGSHYAALAGDGGAYVGQVPIGGSPSGGFVGVGGQAGPSAYGPSGDPFGGGSMTGFGAHHTADSLARAYGQATSTGAHHLQVPAHNYGASLAAAGYPGMTGSNINSLGSLLAAGGAGGSNLLSGSMFPLMSKGFDLSEIVCSAIAIAIGTVIIGAPFILIYLFVINQVNSGSGSGSGGLSPSGGPITLTGPSSNTNVSGRRKRQTGLPEALFRQLSPLMNSEQLMQTFKILMNSLAKYQ